MSVRTKDFLLGLVMLRFLRRQRQRRSAREQSAPDSGPAGAKAGTNVRPLWWKGALFLVRDAAREWSKDKAPRLGAALSYYTVFAIAPVLLVAISVAGLVLGTEAAQGRILDELRSLFGPETARMIQEALAKSAERKSGVLGTVVGVGTLILGSTAVMIELESVLNAVWKVVPKPGGVKGLVRARLLSLGLVLSLGFLLLVSLVTSAGLAALGGQLDRFSFPGAAVVGQVLNNVLSLGLIAAFFTLIFKYLPDANIAWRDVWVGAAITSVLFHVGKIGIGFYLGRATIASTFGAAGSMAVLLVWVYYSAQIVLYGAEVTRLYAERYGSGVRPAEGAVPAANAAQIAAGSPTAT